MKGLEIAKDFFLSWGEPFLEEEFPEPANRIAAGRFMGSDVIGANDEISRDHNWGPQFSLFLSMGIVSGHGTSEVAKYLSPLLNDHHEFTARAAWMSNYRVEGPQQNAASDLSGQSLSGSPAPSN